MRHCPPLLLHGSVNGNVHIEKLMEGGPVVGLLHQATYHQGAVHVEPGDLLVFYSDGVLEAENASGEEFGEERLRSIINERSKQPCSEICTHIVNGVLMFAHNTSLQDDLTVFLVRPRIGRGSS